MSMDNWPAIPADIFDKYPVAGFKESISEYRIYPIAALKDGTFLEVPKGTFAPLLIEDSTTGNYTHGPDQ